MEWMLSILGVIAVMWFFNQLEKNGDKNRLEKRAVAADKYYAKAIKSSKKYLAELEMEDDHDLIKETRSLIDFDFIKEARSRIEKMQETRDHYVRLTKRYQHDENTLDSLAEDWWNYSFGLYQLYDDHPRAMDYADDIQPHLEQNHETRIELEELEKRFADKLK